MFDGCASVSWHFAGVGPVVTDDVVAESHAATHSATTATIGTNAGEYLKGIASLRNSLARSCLVHSVRQRFAEVVIACRAASIASEVRRDGTFFNYLLVRSEVGSAAV